MESIEKDAFGWEQRWVENAAQMQKEECLSLLTVTIRKYLWLHTLSRRRVILTLASGVEAER